MKTIADIVLHTYNVCRPRIGAPKAIEALNTYSQRICIECADIGYGGASKWIYKFGDGSVLSVYADDLLVI